MTLPPMSDEEKAKLQELLAGDRSAMTAGQLREKIRQATGMDVTSLVEIVPPDANPNAPGFPRTVSAELRHARGGGMQGASRYVLAHYFFWQGDAWCRVCGTAVLPGWMLAHYEALHSPRDVPAGP